jgi:beta-lactam-binding protein with PASTA domain
MRARRHTAAGFTFPSVLPSNRLVRDGALVLLTFAVGYAISALWISPSSVLGSNHPIPRVLGLADAEARKKLTDLGFRVRPGGERPNPVVTRGAVVWQDPPPGMVMPPNTTVEIVVSAGPAPVTVPDVVGLALPSAEKIFTAAGVTVGTVDTVQTSGEPGIVIATRPGAGNGRPRGAAVDLVVGSGGGGEL